MSLRENVLVRAVYIIVVCVFIFILYFPFIFRVIYRPLCE
jgi:hypothetical protein